MSVLWNVKSGLTKEKGKTYKILTIHILESYLEEFKTKLNITSKPRRGKKGDLTKDINILNLPDYKNEEIPIEMNPVYKFIIMSEEDRDYLNQLLGSKITPQTRSIWYPERPEHKLKNMMYVVEEEIKLKYPIYILSKGRSESRLTMKTLDDMNVNYKVVIEPQEYKDYNKYISEDKLLILPNEYLNKNQGGIPARNFIWEHSVKNKYGCHWVIDDNIEGFFRWNQNIKLPLKSGICFKMIEDYFDLHENIGQCGIQYSSFYPEISMSRPLYIKNTRIYSCILINNNVNIQERWRGKYNEDTDLSLRILKKGYSTLLFQNFLCGKKTTLSVKGGNCDIYSGDGLQQKLDSLINQHPEEVKGTFKFKKVHHQVDYTKFKDNKIILKKGVKIPEYPPMKLIKNPNKDINKVIYNDDEEENGDDDEEEDIVSEILSDEEKYKQNCLKIEELKLETKKLKEKEIIKIEPIKPIKSVKPKKEKKIIVVEDKIEFKTDLTKVKYYVEQIKKFNDLLNEELQKTK